ncbi:MAG: ribosome maturation factor RimM [Blautia sp.]|nr:ribosome maturation factor RimM [Blautia sp.]
MEDKLKVGVITTTHGVRGEVKVFPTTDGAERFLDLEYVLLDTGKEGLRRLEIAGVKFYKNLAILKFKGIDNINDIEKYKGRDLWILREDAQELEEDEYYIGDLIDMEVILEDGTHFGILKDVMETGANDVYIVEQDDGREVLLPAIYDCITDIDVENNRMTVHLMKGLID